MRALSPDQPLHRAIVVVDAEGSTRWLNPAKVRHRRAMYEVLEQALQASGIGAEHRDPLIDRGDGALLLIRPVDQVPKTRLLTAFLPALRQLLDGLEPSRPDRIRLRAALHAGEIHYDERGPFGEAIDLSCRLLDAPELKIRLRTTPASLVFVVSDDIYRTLIRHRYDGIDDRAFEPLVHLKIAGYAHRGWVSVAHSGKAVSSSLGRAAGRLRRAASG